jgi:hypothetical protein
MKLLIKTGVVLFLSLLLINCGKDSSIETGGSPEQALQVSLDPTPTSSLVRIFSTSYDFKVSIESRMPAQGVDISVVYRQDSDNTVVFSQNYATMTSPQNVTITNIPFNEVGTVTVVVTSKTRSTNTATKTFKLVRK